MVRHMNLEEQVDRDFTQARRRALLRRTKARLHKGLACNRQLSFDEVKGSIGAFNQAYLEMRIVPVVGVVLHENFERREIERCRINDYSIFGSGLLW